MIKTRGHRGLSYTLLTPENHYVSRLPSLPGAELVKLVTPRLSPSRIAQTLVRIGEAGLRAEIAPGFETFLFGLSGAARVRAGALTAGLGTRSFAYLPPDARLEIAADGPAELLWIKRRYEKWPGLRNPAAVQGSVEQITATETATPGLHRRELLDPGDPARDFTMSLMSFDPGVGLPQVEIHDEEHGLYMTGGSGVYLLERDEHQVKQGDFIYMAPYCPQGFAAGARGAEYLLYKDVFRDGF